MSNVVWIPGVLGSALGTPIPGTPLVRPVWVDLPTLAAGDIVALQLAADGVSPGPLTGGLPAVVTDLFTPAYGFAPLYFRALGHSVLALPWDWRLHPAAAGAAATAKVAAWAQGRAVNLVAHSYGGLLARVIWSLAGSASPPFVVGKIITIGTPHYGSFDAARLLCGLPPLYQGLETLTGWGGQNLRGVGPDALWQTVRTHPAWYLLMPFMSSGPLWQYSPAQAALLYSPLHYDQDKLPAVNWLAAAPALQQSLNGLMPSSNFYSVAGVGFNTPWALNGQQPDPYRDDGYQFTQQGDGHVTSAQASPPSATVYQVPVEHTYQPLHPAVLGLVAGLLGPP